MIKHILRAFFSLAIIILPQSCILTAANQPLSYLNSDGMMIVEIKTKNNMPNIEKITVKPGWYNIEHRARNFPIIPSPGQNTSPMLFLYDAAGKIIFKTLFDYPIAKTIPPRLAGSKDQSSPDVIPIENPEVFLPLPYFKKAKSIALYNPGESTPKTVKELAKLDIIYEACHEDAHTNRNSRAEFSISKTPLPEPVLDEEYLHILIIASGYTAADMPVFTQKAEELKSYILSFEPFKTYAPLIGIGIYENTADLLCYRGCSGIARLICCHGGNVIDAAVNSGYLFDEIIVIHNTDVYSGGGYRDNWGSYKTNSRGSYAVVYSGGRYKETAMHEFGHSFGNLCDEYTYGSEGLAYYPCVNCRENCSDWSRVSSACQPSCDARSDYSRPADSIMLALDIPYFNPVSLYAIYEPHGLERRLMYFTGQDDQVFIFVQAERKEEKAWLIRKHYGKIDISMDYPDSVTVSTFLVYRNAAGESRIIKEFVPSDFQNAAVSFIDTYLEKDVTYTYKVEALDESERVIGSSNESSI